MGELVVHVFGARDSFQAAVLARTLYTMMGASGWRLYVHGGLGRLRVIDESRIPVSIASERIVFGGPVPGRGECVLVDPSGEPASVLGGLPGVLVVDYGGSIECAERVRGLGLPADMLHYEAVAVLYELVARRRRWGVEPPGEGPPPGLERLAVKLARRVWDMLGDVDGYSVVKPSASVYILRKLLKKRGLLLDPSTTRISISQVGGGVEEVVEMRVYDRLLRPAGSARLTYTSRDGRLVLEAPGVRLVLAVDRLRGVVYLGRGVLVKRGEGARDSIPWSVLGGWQDAEP